MYQHIILILIYRYPVIVTKTGKGMENTAVAIERYNPIAIIKEHQADMIRI